MWLGSLMVTVPVEMPANKAVLAINYGYYGLLQLR